MNLNKVTVAVVSCAFALGGIVGYTISPSKLQGRLSACKDMTLVINQALPLGLECHTINGDVYVSSPLQPGVKVSLDGSKVIN